MVNIGKMQNLNKGDGTYFGPEDELPAEDLELCKKLALRELADTDGFNLDRNLEIDDELIQVPGQMIALVAFVGPYEFLRAKHPVFQFNIICGCPDPQSAIRKLQKNTDRRYDIYTLGMYEWIALPPNESFMKDPKAHEEFLNNLIIRHRFDIYRRKHEFEVRKTRIMANHRTQDVRTETEVQECDELPQTQIQECILPQEPQIDDVPQIPQPPQATVPMATVPPNGEDWDSSERLDQMGLRSQQWVVLSLVGSLAEGMAVKIQGFYETEEAARKVLDRIRQIDDTFETYVAEAGRWLPAEVRAEDVGDQVFQNEHLTELYRNHTLENQKALDFGKMHPVRTLPPAEIPPGEILDGLAEDVGKLPHS